MTLVAKCIVKNKFWVVEQNNVSVATIQSSPTGITFVKNEKREQFVSIKLLKDKYNITIAKEKPAKRTSEISYEVYGFSCDHKPYNSLLNVAKKLPVYSKTSKSKSFYCAGHYLVKVSNIYTYAYCPKLITLSRYDFVGPFYTKVDAKNFAKKIKESS